MSDLDLTEALAAGRRGLAERLKWPSMHWGVEDVHPDAWPHVVAAAVATAAPLIEAQVRAQAVRLEPWESIALTVASAQLDRGEEPGPNTAAVCIGALERIARGESS